MATTKTSQGAKASENPWLFGTGPYMSAKDWFDSEDVIAGLSLPMIQSQAAVPASEIFSWGLSTKSLLETQ